MASATEIYGALAQAADFMIRIDWGGDEDKPYPKALLVSQHHSTALTPAPFWGYAVISPEEYSRVLDVLRTNHCTPLLGSSESYTSGYYVEIQTDSATVHYALGVDTATLAMCRQLVTALEPANRPPVDAIVQRLQTRVSH